MKDASMKVTLAILALSAGLCAQPVLTITGPASVSGLNTAMLTLTLSGSAATNLTGIQWTIAPQQGFVFQPAVASAQTIAAGKGIYCNLANGICVVITPPNATPTVLSNTPFADGVVATIPILVAKSASGSINLPLVSLIGASTSGSSVTVNSGAAYSVNITSNCDYNGDGVINYLDVSAIISAIIGQSECSANFAAGCSLASVEAVVQAALGGTCPL